MSQPLKLAVLISGNGSNLQSIIDAIESARLNAEIKAVISNNRQAFGLVRATQHGLHTWVLEQEDYKDRKQFDDVLQHYLEAIDPDYIVLAGFMRILGADFIQAFENRILNIHPSLLPAYKGLDTHQRVLDNNEREHGVSIHLVTAKLDDGPIILQASYPIEPGDDAEELQQRGHRLEHRMYPQVLSWLSSGVLSIKDGRLYYEHTPLEKPIPFDA
ncbi:MAG: phosphoribosylglycinamide formyltransferase [Gammaproteobacteria bacterium]|nr:phosphoribosylglycinamide formyltransferase [Gammaproteobacteria bacterium]